MKNAKMQYWNSVGYKMLLSVIRFIQDYNCLIWFISLEGLLNVAKMTPMDITGNIIRPLLHQDKQTFILSWTHFVCGYNVLLLIFYFPLNFGQNELPSTNWVLAKSRFLPPGSGPIWAPPPQKSSNNDFYFCVNISVL